MMAALRSGDWLKPGRARNYALISLMLSVGILAALVATSNGLVDLTGRPLGTDFSQVWAAGHLVLQGRPQDAYDWTIHYGVERHLFGQQTPFYGWHYPPMFLAVAALLATLPYLPALALWQATTAVFALAAIKRIAPGGTVAGAERLRDQGVGPHRRLAAGDPLCARLRPDDPRPGHRLFRRAGRA
jgi:alpha-1,2-mannosyltransferase